MNHQDVGTKPVNANLPTALVIVSIIRGRLDLRNLPKLTCSAKKPL
jgi:hypothetical protein